MGQILNKQSISHTDFNSGYLTPAGLRKIIPDSRKARLRGDIRLSVVNRCGINDRHSSVDKRFSAMPANVQNAKVLVR